MGFCNGEGRGWKWAGCQEAHRRDLAASQLAERRLFDQREPPANVATIPAKEGKVGVANFQMLQIIGTGAYGTVYVVRKLDGSDRNKLYAMKVLQKFGPCEIRKYNQLLTERQVLEAVRRSPFLVNMHYAFQNENDLFFILDFVNGGSLYSHRRKKKIFLESEVKMYVAELVLAVERLHKLAIIHRDIKLENVILDKDGHVVLIDFGLSKKFAPDTKMRRAYSYCGTSDYMAPEVACKGFCGYDKSVDWWSMGVLTYELLSGTSPFSVDKGRNTKADISQRILSCEPQKQSHLSDAANNFIKRLLKKNPRERLGGGIGDAIELKSHPFFEGLNWEDLACKRIPAPFVPEISSDIYIPSTIRLYTSVRPNFATGINPRSNAFRDFSFNASLDS